MLKNRQPIRRFSESLKLKILAEITKGNYTKAQICDMYGIGRTTVNDWIRKYMRDDLMNHRVIVQTMEEQTKVQKLQKEIAMLKELLLKKDLDALVLDSEFEKYDITGWQGRIIEIDHVNGINFEIELDSITLKQISRRYIIESLDNGSDYAIIDVSSSDVEKVKPSDTIKETQAVRKEMNKKLDYVSVLDEEDDLTNLPERGNFMFDTRNQRILNDDLENTCLN